LKFRSSRVGALFVGGGAVSRERDEIIICQPVRRRRVTSKKGQPSARRFIYKYLLALQHWMCLEIRLLFLIWY